MYLIAATQAVDGQWPVIFVVWYFLTITGFRELQWNNNIVSLPPAKKHFFSPSGQFCPASSEKGEL